MTLALEDTATLNGQLVATRGESGELAAGLRLGHFRIEKKLGAGGMGEVYLATDLALDRPVAIKVLPAGTVARGAHDRMVREARAQARVLHPNVAHIYFIGEDEGRLYFAMEYVAGQTLAEKVVSGPMGIAAALEAIRAAVLGLREAHRSGFTHRDVKPSNLMVDAHGGIKVLDFGLAAGAPEHAIEGPVEQTSMAGTPLYMAPEQAAGEAIDQRADIYALGATLYHLVSGAPPFRAETVAELSIMHATAARPALPRGKLTRTASAAVDPLVAKMMALRPEDRFQTYDELLRAIDMISEQRTRPAGFWVRLVAQVIDMLLLFVIVGLVTAPFGGDIDVIPMVVAFLFVSLPLARWGTTLGKALFELEVVSIDTGKKPRLGAVLKREIALFGLPIVIESLGYVSDFRIAGVRSLSVVSAAYVLLVMLNLLLSSWRSPGKRTAWDRWARTQVRYRVTAR